jgi:hypothetical protein
VMTRAMISFSSRRYSSIWGERLKSITPLRR